MVSPQYDYVIVGGGVGGCILANRLTENPTTRVLLLEAGVSDNNPLITAPGGLLPIMMSGRFMWPYMSLPQAHLANRSLYSPRGKVLGGGSSVNGMVYDRGFHSDFDRWAEAGNKGWAFDDVLPYFRKLETYWRSDDPWHGDSGPIQISRADQNHPFARAFVEAGIQAGYPYCDDFNGGGRDGFGPVDLTIGGGKRSSAASAYMKPARKRANLTVITSAHVQRIVFEGRRATGVEFTHSHTRHIVKATREVILCAGAINTPQLLLVSGIGSARHLSDHGIGVIADLPGVGQNLQDHLAAQVRFRSTKPYSMLRYLNPLRGAVAMSQYLLARRGPLADPGMSVACFVRSDPSLAEPDIKMLLVSALFSNNGRTLTPQHGFYAHINVIRPTSRGSVTLAGSDPALPPVIDQAYNSTKEDQRIMREGIRIARHVFNQPAFDAFRGEELTPGPAIQSDAEIDEFVRSHAEADYHAVGTARMGNDKMAVVDHELRVHDVQGLRIVDASIMPFLPGGNTAIPVAMIAEKAADIITRLP